MWNPIPSWESLGHCILIILWYGNWKWRRKLDKKTRVIPFWFWSWSSHGTPTKKTTLYTQPRRMIMKRAWNTSTYDANKINIREASSTWKQFRRKKKQQQKKKKNTIIYYFFVKKTTTYYNTLHTLYTYKRNSNNKNYTTTRRDNKKLLFYNFLFVHFCCVLCVLFWCISISYNNNTLCTVHIYIVHRYLSLLDF